MPWKEMKIIEQRVEFVLAVEKEKNSFSALCEEFGISRKTGYKWIKRYREDGGVDALKDLSRAPDWSSKRINLVVVYELCRLRKKYPHWGPKKLLVKLPKFRRSYKVPSVSTASRILKSKGLVKSRKRRVRTPAYTQPFTAVTAPNQLWCIDFKGHFKCEDGTRVYPLTVMDAYSRFILCCQVMREPRGKPVYQAMKRLFIRYGLPETIRSDNGSPFASVGVAGLSEFNVWWTKLGIRHERIEPGKPQQNGRHERMHLTLKQEACVRPSRTPEAQQQAFNKFMQEFNFDRPHEALKMQTPNEVYVKSEKYYSRKWQAIRGQNLKLVKCWLARRDESNGEDTG
jgi:transposase InsO family protein/transposase-like protein